MGSQIVFINGGRTFDNRDDYLDYLRTRDVYLDEEDTWDEGNYLEENLNGEVVRIGMPCSDNACYEEWKITFQRYVTLLSDEVVLVGFSLGGTFLAKYLSENSFPKRIVSAYLVGAPYDDDLMGEVLSSGFEVGEDLSLLEDNCDTLRLMFSGDDDVVPVRHAEKFRERLSDLEIIEYEGKNGHFQVSEFPELVDYVNGDL